MLDNSIGGAFLHSMNDEHISIAIHLYKSVEEGKGVCGRKYAFKKPFHFYIDILIINGAME